MTVCFGSPALICVVVVAWLSCPRFASSLINCQRGTYYILLELKHECKPCPEGTFMSYDDHTYEKCFDCMKKKNDLEIEVTPCNETHNAVIHCVNGYYRRLPQSQSEKEECRSCTKCVSYTGRPCETYRDAQCCPGKNYDVFDDNKGISKCLEKPWFCEQGHYFDPFLYECEECPEGTFVSLGHHIRTECFKCVNTSVHHLPKNAFAQYPCNSTHDALVTCKEGFYINPSPGFNNDAMGCLPCTNCSLLDGRHFGRKCHHTHDTVCCSQPNMTVEDTERGPECRKPQAPLTDLLVSSPKSPATTAQTPKVCAQNEYLYTDSANKGINLCIPCPCGTFIDEPRHTHTACQNCPDFGVRKLPSPCQLMKAECEHSSNWLFFLVSVVPFLFFGLFIFYLAVRFCSKVKDGTLVIWKLKLKSVHQEKDIHEPGGTQIKNDERSNLFGGMADIEEIR